MIFEIIPLVVLVVCAVLLIRWVIPNLGRAFGLLIEDIEEETANRVVEKLKKKEDEHD